MRSIIRGRRYDTEAPHTRLIARINEGISASDYAYSQESLYLTLRGHWFLSAEGGPSSRWASPRGTYGRRILPFSDAQAQHWLETHSEIDALEQYFAPALEDA